jgi:hypothetical protein
MIIVVTWTELKPLLKGCSYVAGGSNNHWQWAGELKQRYHFDRPLDSIRHVIYGACMEAIIARRPSAR